MKIKHKFLFVKLISSCIDSCNFFSALVFCNVSHLILKLRVQNHSYDAFQNTNGHGRYFTTYSWVSSERHLTLQTKHIYTVFCLLIVYGIKGFTNSMQSLTIVSMQFLWKVKLYKRKTY